MIRIDEAMHSPSVSMSMQDFPAVARRACGEGTRPKRHGRLPVLERLARFDVHVSFTPCDVIARATLCDLD